MGDVESGSDGDEDKVGEESVEGAVSGGLRESATWSSRVAWEAWEVWVGRLEEFTDRFPIGETSQRLPERPLVPSPLVALRLEPCSQL